MSLKTEKGEKADGLRREKKKEKKKERKKEKRKERKKKERESTCAVRKGEEISDSCKRKSDRERQVKWQRLAANVMLSRRRMKQRKR